MDVIDSIPISRGHMKIIMVIFSGMITLTIGSTEKVDEHFTRGINYYKRGMYDKAMEECHNVLSIDSTYVKAYLVLAQIYRQKEKIDQACEMLKKAIKFDPNCGTAYYRLAQIYSNKGQHQLAVDLYRKAAEVSPDLAAICWGNIGWEYYLMMNYSESLKASEKALSMNPNLTYIRYNIGLFYLVRGEMESAVEEYQNAIKSDSNFKAFDRAINDLFRLAKQELHLSEIHYILGILFKERGWHYEAWEQWNKYITVYPNGELIEKAKVLLSTLEILLNDRIKAAIRTWREYIESVKEGSRDKAIHYWSEATRRRYPAFDWQMPKFQEAVEFVNNNYMAITELKEKDSYIELQITSPKKHFTYYLHPERGRMVLVNPITVFTKGWAKKETEHFIFHYKKGEEPHEFCLKKLDEIYKELSLLFGVSLPGKIDYYRCEWKEVGKLFAMEPAIGRAHIINYTIAATRWSLFHEVVHILLGQLCEKQPVSLILEGAACCFGGTGLITKEAQLSWAKTLVESGEYLPISAIVYEKEFWAAEDMNDPYAEAGSFVKFLIDTYGVNKFKELYKDSHTPEDCKTLFKKLYKKEITQLENEWKEWILQLKLLTIEVGINESAEEVIAMDDPSYDDNGDGDYTYPLDSRYKPGMFDLIKFRVLKDKGRVNFELKYRNLVSTETDEWGFWKTYTRIGIDCGNREIKGGTYFGRDVCAVLAEEHDYWISISDLGILVWTNERGILGVIRKNLHNQNLGDTLTNTIKFSIPIDMIGEPNEHWKYVVAVGGREGGGKGLREEVGRFMKVGKIAMEEQGGGGLDSDVNPNIYDILLPSSENQVRILSDYDSDTGKLIVLPLIGLK